MIDYSNELNPEQYEGVTTIEGPVLIIAGAGSGKTRVITYRMAYMLEKGIPQSQILALTFTNKAAKEMADRVRDLTQKKLQNLTVSTFHAFGVQILRKEIHNIGWKENFTIYDEVDKHELIKECLKELGLVVQSFDVSALAYTFSGIKNGQFSWSNHHKTEQLIFKEYQASLKAYNAVDFDDLIILPIRIFTEFQEIREKYRNHYRYIMVDEFQDTSIEQYKFLKLLADKNICVVGDDDQSIYSWRGANYENILSFEKDWPERKLITLYRNYRSTTTILNAANSVIANNKNRKEKNLESPHEGGALIEVHMKDNEIQEADFIASAIRELKMLEHYRYDQFGVLVRTNGSMRFIEEAFISAGIPYKLTGGTSFFQRKEIKDVISYLRAIANPDDDINLLRIINVPRRGLGRKSVETITEFARSNETSIHDALNHIVYTQDERIGSSARGEISVFIDLLARYREELLGRRGLAKRIKKLIDDIDYWGHLVSENLNNDKAAKWKFLNVERLIQGIEMWEQDPDNFDPTLFAYLNRISLVSRDDQEEEEGGKVNVMTIHASKGLEFDIVLIPGCEEGIIPHARSLEESASSLEEERRLFYVALTRARKKIIISGCRIRKRGNTSIESTLSPFLEEIPEHLITWKLEETPLTEEDSAKAWDALKNMLESKRK